VYPRSSIAVKTGGEVVEGKIEYRPKPSHHPIIGEDD
jgi:hypothetical protein